MKKVKRITLLLAGVFLSCSLSVEAAEINVIENVSTDTTWTSENVYLLGQPIFVVEGATLSIEPGTVIYGFENVEAGTFGSLVITRGAKLMAEGTREQPIIFTALADRDEELTLEDSSLWGGLIILGRAVLNDSGNPVVQPESPLLNEREIEGFPSGGNNEFIKYGGLDDDDDSGVLRYASIRYGGFQFQQDEEINGLTLGAVGRGTTIEYVEVFNNSDDGVEFFGGTVNTKYMVMAFNEDEQFDIDQGYRGKGQFWFGIGKSVGNGSNYGAEHDGGDSPDKTLEPFARPRIYNATFLGSGVNDDNPQTNTAFRLKDNFAGQYHNSIFGDFPGKAIRIDDASTRDRANAEGDLAFVNNLWFDIGSYDGSFESLTENGSEEELKQVNAQGNVYSYPYLGGVSRRAAGGLDPRPLEGGPAYTMSRSTVPADGFFEAVGYVGAFSSGDNWMEGWTMLSRSGYLPQPAPAEPTDVEVTANITENTTWTRDHHYLLGQPVFVTNGAVLTIEAGTKVYGYEDAGKGTFGSLVITRGAKIFAEGTREHPIVFSALEARETELTLEDSSLWGGLILLGRGILNDAGNPLVQPENPVLNEREIEGFPSGGDNAFIAYGGLDDGDDSGVLRYVSIGYGGFQFQQDEEINGLTLGAVGSGTTIEFVEVFNNSDDGVEFFGGTVDVRYLVMAFNEDEQFDIDQGYRGRGQFLFGIGKAVGNGSNYGAEHDGGDSPDKTLEPFARSRFYNVTYLGSGADGVAANPQSNTAFRLKDNFAGQYHNSVFGDFQELAMRIDDDATKARVNEGDLYFGNNAWFDFGAAQGSELAALTKNGSAEELLLLSPERGNEVMDPLLRGISRTADGGLDPRPQSGSSVFGAPQSDFPAGQRGFFQPVDYRGAFGAVNWMAEWTFLAREGYLGDLSSGLPRLSDVTRPGDSVTAVFGVDDGDGAAGDPPAGEGVAQAIDDRGQKYLNFFDLGSGLVVTPGLGATRVTGVRLYTANDAIERDPASYQLEGSVAGPGGPWIVIADGALSLPEERNAGGDTGLGEGAISATTEFENPWAYLSYRLTFPTLRDAQAANSMQIAEIELLGVEGGTLNPSGFPVDPGLDSDGDGTPDAIELANGTDPESAAEFFRATLTAGGRVLTWTGSAAQQYEVEFSMDLREWTVIATVPGLDGETSFEDTDAARRSAGMAYYRVVLP